MNRNMLTHFSRVKSALNHTEPDMVPLDLGSTKMTGISIKAYRRFIDYKGWNKLDNDPVVADPVQQLAYINEDVLKMIGVDTRGLIPKAPSGFRIDYRKTDNYTRFTDEWGVEWQMPDAGGNYFDMASHPLAGEITLEEISRFSWPDPLDKTRISGFTDSKRRIGNPDDFAFVMHGICAGVLEMALRLRGFEQAFIDMKLEPEIICGIMDRIVEIKAEYWEKALKNADKNVLVAVEADDLGTQNSLLISPELYRKLIKPRHKKLFDSIKKSAPHIKIFLHSCGAIKPLIPDLIEAGVDILNPVQVSADNMDTKKLKKEFGDALVFWGGGIDTQSVLPFGTPEQVKDEVKRRIDDLAPGGGFIFNTIHNIQADVPPQNIEAMLDAFEQNRIY